MTAYAAPIKYLVVLYDTSVGRIVTEGSFILPGTNRGAQEIMKGLGVVGPGIYSWAVINGRPEQVVDVVPPDLDRAIRESLGGRFGLPPLALARLRAPFVRAVHGAETPDYVRHLLGDGYVVRMAEGPMMLASEHQDLSEVLFYGASPVTQVVVTDKQGGLLGILMPTGSDQIGGVG